MTEKIDGSPDGIKIRDHVIPRDEHYHLPLIVVLLKQYICPISKSSQVSEIEIIFWMFHDFWRNAYKHSLVLTSNYYVYSVSGPIKCGHSFRAMKNVVLDIVHF